MLITITYYKEGVQEGCAGYDLLIYGRRGVVYPGK